MGFAKRTRAITAAAALAAASLLLQGNIGLRSNLDQRLLAAHNMERSTAGLPRLEWNEELAASAVEWGEAMAATDEFEHAPDGEGEPQGENLFMGTRDIFAPEEMVGMWIDEKQHYKPGIFPDNSRTGDLEDVGHYTQLMWRDTRQVGCAVVPNQEYDYLVCRYAQAGNVIGERPF